MRLWVLKPNGVGLIVAANRKDLLNHSRVDPAWMIFDLVNLDQITFYMWTLASDLLDRSGLGTTWVGIASARDQNNPLASLL